MYLNIFKETLKGKSLNRILQNIEMSKVKINGDVIDLGSKSIKSPYYEYITKTPDTNITFTDLNPTNDGVLKIDLEKPLPIKTATKDYVILSNVLEHLFNHNSCITESYRILKKDGQLIGFSPFLYHFHPDPNDYFRYTHSALKKLFKQAGFSDITIKPLGFGPVSTGVSQFAVIAKFKPLIACIYIASVLIDKLLNKIFKNNETIKPSNFALTYFFVCKK